VFQTLIRLRERWQNDTRADESTEAVNRAGAVV